jgi:predicted DNA-binding transcriptional regulator AlpA
VLDPFPRKVLLSAKEVRVMLSLSTTAWKKLLRQKDGGFPRPVRLPTGGLRYRKDHVLDWVSGLRGEDGGAVPG